MKILKARLTKINLNSVRVRLDVNEVTPHELETKFRGKETIIEPWLDQYNYRESSLKISPEIHDQITTAPYSRFLIWMDKGQVVQVECYRCANECDWCETKAFTDDLHKVKKGKPVSYGYKYDENAKRIREVEYKITDFHICSKCYTEKPIAKVQQEHIHAMLDKSSARFEDPTQIMFVFEVVNERS